MPPSDSGSTRIQLCGRLKADLEGRHVTPALRGRQGRILLAYLVLNRGRPVSRDELIAAIWPESPPSDPSAALRTQLSRLRAALGSGSLAGRDAVELRLPENIWIDVEAADRAIVAAGAALGAADWKDAWVHAHIALNIAGRPFLAGFEAPWVDETRHELEELHLRAREIIARAGIGLGGSELAGAERAARALIREAPFRESGYVLLMRALVASGNAAEALRTYDDLRNLLAEELGSAPGAEAQGLHRKLLGGGAVEDEGPAPKSAAEKPAVPSEGEHPARLPLPTWLVPRRRSPFIGRAAELERLERLWGEAREEGVRNLVFLGGDPGVGKTRLATEFAAGVHEGGGGVLYGRADERASFDFQPFVEALRHWVLNSPTAEIERDLGPHAGVLAGLIPEISVQLSEAAPEASENGKERLFEAVAGCFAALSARRPLLLVLDDVHWADPGSLTMLRHVARSPHRTALMILAAYRETEPSEALAETLADLGREGLFERQHLSGLGVPEVRELIASIRGSSPEPGLTEAIQAETGGNPFLIEALVHHISASGEGGAIGQRPGAIYASGVPDLVREAIDHRVGELGEGPARVLEVASVIGSEFDSELAIEVCEMPGEDVIAALETAVAAGLLADVPGTLERYAFSHALFRQTVYAGVSRRRRAALHRRLAEVLECHHGNDPHHVSELARHYAGAGPAAAGKALEFGVRAGAGALGSLSFEKAIEHYAEALGALDASGQGEPKLRLELLLALGEAEWRGGELESSRETFASAARVARSSGDAEGLARAALGFCGFGSENAEGRPNDAAELLAAALAAAPPAVLCARLKLRLAQLSRAGGEKQRAAQLGREALELAEGSGDPDTLALALIERWAAEPGPGGSEQRLAVSVRLAGIIPELRDRDIEIQARFLLVLAALQSADFAELDVAIAEHARIAERMKQAPGRLRSRALMTARSLMEGQFADAERLTAEVLELGAWAEVPDALTYTSFELAVLRWEQGRLGETEELLRDLISRRGQGPVWHSFLALLLTEAGRPEEAREELDAAAERAAASRGLAAQAIAAIAVAALGDRERAAKLHRELLPGAGGIVVGGAGAAYLGPVSHHLGVLALVGGSAAEAVEQLTEAVAVNERAGALPWLARSRFELARALAARRGRGDSERAGALLADASRTAEDLGMALLLRRIGGEEDPLGLCASQRV
jgi:DNA-binding SARP family transcriptional activator/tetratricopeptide (TPR) repeat protein